VETEKEKKQQVEALLKRAETGVKKVFESDRYRKYLETMSKFHNYSFRNNMLILLQNPAASYVAGYSAWQSKFGRQVLKGEKGIQIVGYAPEKRGAIQEKKDQHGNPVLGAYGIPETELVVRTVPNFVPVYVYDVSQTYGKPLPKLTSELDGSVDGYNDLAAALAKVSPFAIAYKQMGGDEKGYCDHRNNRLVIKEGMSQAHTIKSIIHEMTHADLHSPESKITMAERKDKRTREVEAESTAFVVCARYNIDTSNYSFPYLASWSSGKDLKELQGSLETIQKQANALIERIDARLAEIQADREENRERPKETTASKESFTPKEEVMYEQGYGIFQCGGRLGDEAKAAKEFAGKSGWNITWVPEKVAMIGDIWIVYRDMDALPFANGFKEYTERNNERVRNGIRHENGDSHSKAGAHALRENAKGAGTPGKAGIDERLKAAKAEAERRNAIAGDTPKRAAKKEQEV